MRIKHGVLFTVYGAVLISGQTRIDLSSQGKNIDFTSAPSVRPFRGGTALPATCLTGEMFFKMDAPPGSNSYGCVALNTWILQGQSGGTVTNTLGGLTTGLPIIGNGGADVAAGTRQGNTTKFISYAGNSPAANDCARFDANGNLTTNGATCGTGGGGPTYVAGSGVTITGTTISADRAFLQDIASEQSNIHASVLALGGPTAYVAAGSTTYTAYTTRMLLTVQFGVPCAGGVTTIDLDALGPKQLLKNDGRTNLASTDCALNQIQQFVYNNAGAFQLVSGGGGAAFFTDANERWYGTAVLAGPFAFAQSSTATQAGGTFSGATIFGGFVGGGLRPGAGDYVFWDIEIPQNWTGTISIKPLSTTDGSDTIHAYIVNWQSTCFALPVDMTVTPTFNTASVVTRTTPGVTFKTGFVDTITNLDRTGCRAGDILRLRALRPTDTNTGPVWVHGVKVGLPYTVQ